MEPWQKGQATREIWPVFTSETPDCRSPTFVALLFVPSINLFVCCVSGLSPICQNKEKYLITIHTRDGEYWVRFQPLMAQVAFSGNLKNKAVKLIFMVFVSHCDYFAVNY